MFPPKGRTPRVITRLLSTIQYAAGTFLPCEWQCIIQPTRELLGLFAPTEILADFLAQGYSQMHCNCCSCTSDILAALVSLKLLKLHTCIGFLVTCLFLYFRVFHSICSCCLRVSLYLLFSHTVCCVTDHYLEVLL